MSASACRPSSFCGAQPDHAAVTQERFAGRDFRRRGDLHLNGDTLHVIHVANAHTDGDSLVHWQEGDVIHMGDTFFTGRPAVHRPRLGRIDRRADRGGEQGAGAGRAQHPDHPGPRADGDPRRPRRLSRHAGRRARQGRGRNRGRAEPGRSRRRDPPIVRNGRRLHQAGPVRRGGLNQPSQTAGFSKTHSHGGAAHSH
jgi:hypothetical protein